MPTSARRERYLAYNMVLWFGVFLLSVTFLFGLRHYGNTFASRHDAKEMLRTAEDAYRRNDLEQAQRDIVAALDGYPDGLRDVMDRFCFGLVLMPSAEDAVRHALDVLQNDAASESLPAAVRFELLYGDVGKAKTLMVESSASRDWMDVNLWLGRMELLEGRYTSAASHFEKYWSANSRERVALRDAVLSLDGESRISGAYSLLEIGLWREAVNASESFPPGADKAFFKGLGAVLNGDSQKAETFYRAVLKERPNHWHALRGLRDLLYAGDEGATAKTLPGKDTS